jgi:hypothetical protein
MRTGWTDQDVKQACTKFDRVHEKLIREGGGIISIYYHPCEFMHRQFWDGVNFSHGANPPRSQWKLPPLKSPAEQKQAFKAFETYLDHIVNHPGVRLVTAREIPSLYPDRVYCEPLTQSDVQTIAKAFEQHVSYVALDGRIVSAAEGLLALSHLVAGATKDHQPENITLEFAYGPSSAPQRFVTEGTFHLEAIQEAAQELLDIVHKTKQLPSIIWVAGEPVRPEDFAVTLASIVAKERYSENITIRQGELEAKKYVADDSPRLWGWVIFPKGFNAPHMMEIAKLQSWTIKPATLRKQK